MPRKGLFKAFSRRAVDQRKVEEEEERKRKEAAQLYSDNSDEEADLLVHDFQAADERTGRMVYLSACDEHGERPISNFVDKLGEELVVVKHHGLKLGMVDAMTQTLKVNSCVRMLSLADNRIGDRGAELLAEGLAANTTLESVDLSSNRLTDKGTAVLAAVLAKPGSSLTSLSLAENKLGRRFMRSLADGLQRNTSLLTLDLHHGSLSDRDAVELGPALDANAVLQELNLAWNDVRDLGGVALAKGLELGRLRQLDLSFNRLGDEAAVAFAEALKTNNALTSLDISHNRVGTGGALALAEALPENSALVALRLGFNAIGFAATKAIIQALTSNDTLSVLGLQNTVTGSVGAAEADMGDESKANGGGNTRGAASPSNKGKKDTTDAPTAAPHKPAMPTVLSLYDIVDSVCAERGKLVSVSLEWPELVRAGRKL